MTAKEDKEKERLVEKTWASLYINLQIPALLLW